jgi:hypothetical protein
MRPTFGTEARTGAGPVDVREGPALIIWCDWKGEFYAFCSRRCLLHYEGWVCDPGYLFEKATCTDASFGCIWCGGDLTLGAIWLSQEHPAGSGLSR